MQIKVTKITGIDRLRKANSFTTGKESKMTLAKAYALGHTTIRTQRFDLELYGIPLFVASQLVRSHEGVDWWMRTKRPDRGGKDFRTECRELAHGLRQAAQDDDYEWIHVTADVIDELCEHYDRYAPTDLMGDLNAEAFMNMAHKRLCAKASKETREVVAIICYKVSKVDPDLAKHMVPQCIYRGGICPEYQPCGIHKNEKMLNEYKALYGL